MKTNCDQLTKLYTHMRDNIGSNCQVTMDDWNSPYKIPSHAAIMASLLFKSLEHAGSDLDYFRACMTTAYAGLVGFAASLNLMPKPAHFAADRAIAIATANPDQFTEESARVATDLYTLSGAFYDGLGGWRAHQVNLASNPDAPVDPAHTDQLAAAFVRVLVAMDRLCTNIGVDIHADIPKVVTALALLAAVREAAKEFVGILDAAPNN